MSILKWISSALLLSLSGCLFETKVEVQPLPGYVNMEIHLKPNPSALFKKASADTLFTLDSLKIVLSAPSTASTTYAYALSGRADSANIVVTTKVFALAALRTWKAKIFVFDLSVNPAKTDTVYQDSVSFTINPGDTAYVSKTANSAFSILRGRMVSNSPASLTHDVKWLRLRVDGITRDSIPVGPILRGISFGSNTNGVAVGDLGTILRTTNAASNWSAITSGTNQQLNAVSFPASNTGYVVGNAGTALKTTTGTSWVAQTSGTTQDLNGTHFSGTSAGYAVGNAGTIKISNGTTWTNPTTNPATQNLNAVYATSSTNAFAVGNAGTILKTTNTGVTWTALSSTTTRNLRGVFFTSTTTGYAVGDSGLILKTTNGTSWAALSSGTTVNLQGVYFSSASTGYVVGDAGVLLRTTDATAWSKVNLNTVQDLRAIWWTSNKSAGAIVGSLGTLLRSTNGTTWTNYLIGTKSFDMLLTYKYLTPNISHTLLMDAIDTLSGPLRGYQVSKTVLLSAGKDTTVTPSSSLSKCGYVGFANCL